jgi:tetratricopeptide (TPR) repeat protein
MGDNSFFLAGPMNRFPTLILLGLATVLLGLAGTAPARAQLGVGPQRLDVSVRVSDQSNGAVLDQVKLELVQFPSSIAHVLFTDSSGRAEFPTVVADQYIVRASKIGYQPYQVTINPARGQLRYEVSIELQPTASNATGPGGVISARELSIPEGARNEFSKGLEFLNERKDPGQGIIHFQNAIANFPSYYEAYFLLGMAHLQTNSPSEGQTALRKAIELNPKFLEPYYPLADLLVRQKQYEEAERLLLQALAQDKQDWRWPFELAFAYAKHGQWDKAMEYGQMASAQPNAPSKVHLLMADLYSNTGNASKAIAELEEFEKIDPHSSHIPRVQQVLGELRKQNLTSQQKPAAAPPEH